MKEKEVENITSNYMACLGFYRMFYILNWYLLFCFKLWTKLLQRNFFKQTNFFKIFF